MHALCICPSPGLATYHAQVPGRVEMNLNPIVSPEQGMLVLPPRWILLLQFNRTFVYLFICKYFQIHIMRIQQILSMYFTICINDVNSSIKCWKSTWGWASRSTHEQQMGCSIRDPFDSKRVRHETQDISYFPKKKILSLNWMAIVAGVHIQHNQVKNYPKRKHTTFCQTWSSLPLVAASTRFGVWKNGHLQQWSFKSLMTMWIFLVNTSGNLVPFFESDERVIILEYAWISYAFNFVCKKSVRKTHAIGRCWNVHGIYNLWYLSPGWHHILGLGHFYHALPLLGRVCMSQ